MSILHTNSETRGVDVQTGWGNAVEQYHGFESAHPEVAAACVDQAVMCKCLEADSFFPSLVLSPSELKVWMALGMDYTRKLHWLMGRLAVKKAIWEILSGFKPSPQEIEIFNAEDGSPYFRCAAINPQIKISIAHTDGLAIAAASQQANSLGIDVERIDRYGPASHSGEEFPQMSFSQEERAQIEQCAGKIDSTILTRIWTAKEAAGKAAQLGLGLILKHCKFNDCSKDLATITLYTGEDKNTVDVKTVQEKEFFLALAVL